MKDDSKKIPHCFGVLEKVFPKGSEGLRNTPGSCMHCIYKIACLRSAMAKSEGLKVREEIVDRAYSSGMINFFGRWSQKKTLKRKIKERSKRQYNGGSDEDD